LIDINLKVFYTYFEVEFYIKLNGSFLLCFSFWRMTYTFIPYTIKSFQKNNGT